ncbi:ComF family protein [Rubrobacter calidifluminis]|uniref:ComF family protein n=1 Tax=Rubrobacter calidifluminis TaxID=1392640 RepID=UPI00235F3B4F|nr:ComF family protein [Rubrobacter calidifluminis]
MGEFEPYLLALADLFYPQRCVGCGGRSRDVLCRGCFERLPRISGPVCDRCGAPSAHETPVCERCRGVDYAFERARSALVYEGVGREVVRALKYQACLEVAERLAAPLLEELAEGRFDMVVPVPLHRSRLRRRGFNQSWVIARALGRRINTPASDKLVVVRRTRDQVDLSGRARWANVRGAFGVRGSVRGKVLLVDDVFTTGATLSACSSALLEAGAERVCALSLCRALH